MHPDFNDMLYFKNNVTYLKAKQQVKFHLAVLNWGLCSCHFNNDALILIFLCRPNKVIAIFNVTTDQVTHPKVLLQLIVDSLRKGEIKTFDEPVSGKLLLDVRGFKFLNSKGKWAFLK